MTYHEWLERFASLTPKLARISAAKFSCSITDR